MNFLLDTVKGPIFPIHNLLMQLVEVFSIKVIVLINQNYDKRAFKRVAGNVKCYSLQVQNTFVIHEIVRIK